MARLFKRNVLAPLPPTAAIVDVNGRWVARWTEGGERREADAVQWRRAGDRYWSIVTGKSSSWYGKVRLGPRAWKVVRLYTDKTASARRLAELQRQADRFDAGVTSADIERLGRPITELAGSRGMSWPMASIARHDSSSDFRMPVAPPTNVRPLSGRGGARATTGHR